MEVRAPDLGQVSAECWRVPSGLLPDQLYHTSLFRPGEKKEEGYETRPPPTSWQTNGGSMGRNHLSPQWSTVLPRALLTAATCGHVTWKSTTFTPTRSRPCGRLYQAAAPAAAGVRGTVAH